MTRAATPCPDFLAEHATAYRDAYLRMFERIQQRGFSAARDAFNVTHPPGTGWPKDATPVLLAAGLGAFACLSDYLQTAADVAEECAKAETLKAKRLRAKATGCTLDLLNTVKSLNP